MINKNTAGRYSKSKGITIKQISTVSGVKPGTLDLWFKNRLPLFDALIEGCKIKLKETKSEQI